MAGKKGQRTFGAIRKLPSGRYQARYRGPDGRTYSAKTKQGDPLTFLSKAAADKYLAIQNAAIDAGTWAPPPTSGSPPPGEGPTLEAYAEAWLLERDVATRTRDHYRHLLDKFVLPTLGAVPLDSITPAVVRTWHAGLPKDKPTVRSHAYGLLRSILATAVADEALPANPCRIRGAGQVKRARTIEPASMKELEAIVAAIEPEQFRLLVLLAAWCALRFGELAELRRSDVDLKTGTIRVRRGVVRVADGSRVVKGPKSEAGVRDVAVPPHLLPALREHLAVVRGRDGLLFPAVEDPTRHLAHSTLNRAWLKARVAAGRPDLAFHDLRHTGAVLAAQTGATLAELMARLGHSTPSAAMRYQHAAAGRDRLVAERLSELAALGDAT